MPTAIAFDPSIVTTGCCVVTDGRLVHYGDIRVKGKDMPERLGFLMTEVERLIETFKPNMGAVEKPPPFSFGRSTDSRSGKALNVESIMKCSNAMAVISGVLGKHGIPVEEFDAHLWKIYMNQNLGKEQMILFAKSLYPALRQVVLSSHVAEAVCMATFTRQNNNLQRCLNGK